MDGKNFRLISGSLLLGAYRRTEPSVGLILLKLACSWSKVKTVTDSQTKALFCSFSAWL